MRERQRHQTQGWPRAAADEWRLVHALAFTDTQGHLAELISGFHVDNE